MALVTGAASGIGLACVARFVREGARVVGLDLAEPQHRAGRCRQARPTCRSSHADVRDEDGDRGAIDATVAEHGRLDAVVTAAGVAGGGPAHLVDRDEWQRVLDINLTGTFLVCKHAIARMLEQPLVDGERGSVVTIASVEGLEGTAGGSSYNASKGAVVIFTKNLAIDYGRSGVRVERRSARASSRRRCSKECSACPASSGARAHPRRAQAASARSPRGDRGGGGVPRVGRRVVRDRAGDRGRRRVHRRS